MNIQDISGMILQPGDRVAWKRRRTNSVRKGKIIKIVHWEGNKYSICIRPEPIDQRRWTYLVTCYQPKRIGLLFNSPEFEPINKETINKIAKLR